MFDVDLITEDVRALVEYVNDRDLSPEEVADAGAYIAGIALGQLSRADELARRRMFESVKYMVERGAQLSDAVEGDVLIGNGRWHT